MKEVPCKSPRNVGPSVERKMECCGEDQGSTCETKASISQVEAKEIDPAIRKIMDKYQDVFREFPKGLPSIIPIEHQIPI